MIIIEGTRKKDGTVYPFSSRQELPLNALRILIEAELQFGANIIGLTETKIVTQTTILGCVDTDTFYGSKEDMEPLVKATSFYVMADERHDLVISNAAKTASVIGHTGFMAMAAPLIMGQSKLKMMLLIGLGLSEEKDLEAGMKHSFADIKVLGEYMVETGVSFQESVAQLT